MEVKILDSTNPFSVQRVRPGAISFLFPQTMDATALVWRLAQQRWWGQIVGGHGSGKSTLLSVLESKLESEGRQIVRFTLQRGVRRLDYSDGIWTESTQVIIDGFEQLSRWNRYRIRMLCRARKCGLLVTSHRSIGLPELYHTHVTLSCAQKIVERLQLPETSIITGTDVESAFTKHGGNMRETLFSLYDLYELRRS